MMKFILAVLYFSVLFSFNLRCQEKSDARRSLLEGGVEHLLERATEEDKPAPLADVLDRLQEDPIDLNRANSAELQQIPGLDPLLATRIASHRSQRPFRLVEDLLQVDGVTPDIFRTIQPFVTVAKSTRGPAAGRNISFRTRVTRDLVQARSFANSEYPGSPERLYSRFIARIRGVQDPFGSNVLSEGSASPSLVVGFSTEKDPGERNYLDFVAGHLLATIPSLSTTILLGDYSVESAQGLVFCRPMGLSKGFEATANVGGEGVGIRPSLSTAQTWLFRGIGANVALDAGDVVVFYSNKQLDAAIDSNGVIARFDTDGLHRTEAELQRRNRAREAVLGARVSFDVAGGLKIGASGFRARFDRIVNLAGPFGFRGNEYSVVGFDAAYTQSTVAFFAEAAQDHKKAIAGVLGLLLSPRADTKLALVVRSYPRDFKNFHGSGFSEVGIGNENESGAYCGFKHRLSEWLTISTYYDQYVRPWRTTVASFPSSGNELCCEADFRPIERFDLDLHFRQKEKPTQFSVLDPLGLPQGLDGMRKQRNYRATLLFKPSKLFTWKSRVEAVAVLYPDRQEHESGMLVYQDLSLVPFPELFIKMRAIAFHTDSYDSRVYEFEDDAPGSSLNPALFGKGIRWYVAGRIEYNRSIVLTMKYSQTRYAGGKTVRRGVDGVSNLDSRLVVQIDVKL